MTDLPNSRVDLIFIAFILESVKLANIHHSECKDSNFNTNLQRIIHILYFLAFAIQ